MISFSILLLLPSFLSSTSLYTKVVSHSYMQSTTRRETTRSIYLHYSTNRLLTVPKSPPVLPLWHAGRPSDSIDCPVPRQMHEVSVSTYAWRWSSFGCVAGTRARNSIRGSTAGPHWQFGSRPTWNGFSAGPGVQMKVYWSSGCPALVHQLPDNTVSIEVHLPEARWRQESGQHIGLREPQCLRLITLLLQLHACGWRNGM